MKRKPPKYRSKKKWLRLSDVPTYIYDVVGVKVSRASVYNWTKNGRIAYDGRKIVLRMQIRGVQKFTQEEWVDKFIQEFQESI